MLLRIVYCSMVCSGEGMVPGTGHVAQDYWIKHTNITQFWTTHIWEKKVVQSNPYGISTVHNSCLYCLRY
jgi:hypothetical protein